jgi:hypothetical protein
MTQKEADDIGMDLEDVNSHIFYTMEECLHYDKESYNFDKEREEDIALLIKMMGEEFTKKRF